MMDLVIGYTPQQEDIFFNSNARVKIIPKGRRFGLTKGFANYCMDISLDNKFKILWVDTSNGNIDRYVDRYFKPVLFQLPSSSWKYNYFRKEMKIGDTLVDFRSADRPETLEGFGYDYIITNEAGIVLKDEYLWYNAILPMTLDYKAKMLIGGTPKGKRNKKLKKEHLFLELCKKCNNFDEYAKKLGLSDFSKNNVNSEWQLFHYTSYNNPLLEKDDIDELVKDTPYAVRRQEIFAEFVEDVTSQIIKGEWWEYFVEDPLFVMKVDSWDTAFKKNEENDYSVKTSWYLTRDGFYLYDYQKSRMEFPELKKKVVESATINQPDVILIEDKASGISLIQELQETALPVKPIKVDRDKIARANAAAPTFEARKVHIKKNMPWTNEVIQICEDFPEGEEDDTVDSVTQAVNYMKNTISDMAPSILSLKRKSLVENY